MIRVASPALLIGLLTAGASAEPIAPTQSASLAAAQQRGSGAGSRRLATIDSVRQFPGYFHLQNVLLRGELVESNARIMLRADEREIRVVLEDKVRTPDGSVEVRGQIIDVGRLEPGDPRVGSFAEGRDTERWPRPGEELFVRVTAVSEPSTSTAHSVRALALEPWRFDGQRVTLTGNFRGRNLFGDLPDAPGKSRYDFVLRGSEGAVWVTGLRPRGKGFDLDVNRRLDTDRWVEVTGKVVHERGLVSVEATQITLAKQPELTDAEEEDDALPPPPLEPVQVVFSSPSDGETDVSASDAVRIQFSRGLNEASLPGGIRASYVGTPASDAGVPLEIPKFDVVYDGGNRALTIRFAAPLERFRTVRVEVLDTLKGFDGAPVAPWIVTFSIGE